METISGDHESVGITFILYKKVECRAGKKFFLTSETILLPKVSYEFCKTRKKQAIVRSQPKVYAWERCRKNFGN